MRWMLTMVAGAMAAVVMVADAPTAEACSCVGPRIRVLPDATSPAPVNTHVWIELPPYSRAFGRQTMDYKRATFELRIAGGDLVQVRTRRDVKSGSVHFVELVPHSDLRARSEFQVTMYLGKKHQTIGRFTTGAKRSLGAPKVKLKKATYSHPPAVCCNCSTGNPFVRFEVKEPKANKPAVYAVWMSSNKNKPIDFSAAPTAYVRPWYSMVTVGHPSTCSPRNLVFPKNAQGFRFGIIAMDVAGNQSAPMETYVKSHSPGSRRPGRRP